MFKFILFFYIYVYITLTDAMVMLAPFGTETRKAVYPRYLLVVLYVSIMFKNFYPFLNWVLNK